ncbi:sugar nucleotide-binding protein [Proteobacteria bacterium 005FR1]|nr:sugar nucleotide-binding protein [Proteobacteria bacterium 005FR1]
MQRFPSPTTSSYGNNFVKHGAPTSAQSIASCILRLAKGYPGNGTLDWGTFHFSGTPHTTWHGIATEVVARASQLGLIDAVSVSPIPAAEFPAPERLSTGQH